MGLVNWAEKNIAVFKEKKEEAHPEIEEFQKMTACEDKNCEDKIDEIFTCSECGKSFCKKHIESHNCDKGKRTPATPELPAIIPELNK